MPNQKILKAQINEDLSDEEKTELARSIDRAKADNAHEEKMLAYLESTSKKIPLQSKKNKRPDTVGIVLIKRISAIAIYAVVFLFVIQGIITVIL